MPFTVSCISNLGISAKPSDIFVRHSTWRDSLRNDGFSIETLSDANNLTTRPWQAYESKEETQMGETDSELTAGNFCWFELHTNDGPSAKEFYTQLFGWETLEIPIGPDEVYVMFKLNGGEVAAMHQLTPAQQGQGTPTHWMTYVRVKGADNSAERAVELGAKIVMPPFDVMG